MELDGMTFEPADIGITYMKPTELPTDGKYLVGQYKETFTGQYGPNHKIAAKDAGMVVVNGCGSLNAAFENVEPGTWVAISYRGKKKLTKGKFAGKEFNDVEVAICNQPVAKVETTEPAGKAVSADEIPF